MRIETFIEIEHLMSLNTALRNDTVQHVLHSLDLGVKLDFDFSVKYDESRRKGLSDHLFVCIHFEK